MRWEESAVRSLGSLEDGEALVRGQIVSIGDEALALPIPLPAGAGAADKIVLATVDVEAFPWLARPERERHECLRSFRMADATGMGIVRFPQRLRPVLEIHLKKPFLHVGTPGRDAYLRTLLIGSFVTIHGLVHREVDVDGSVAGGIAYRDAALVPVIDALAVFDEPAWAARAVDGLFPWLRRLLSLARGR